MSSEKIQVFLNITQRTIKHIKSMKQLQVYEISTPCPNAYIRDLLAATNALQIDQQLSKENNDISIKLQNLANELSLTFKKFGTERLDDLLLVCFGSTFKINNNKLDLLMEYFHPVSYRLYDGKKEPLNDGDILNIPTTNDCFHLQVSGIQVVIMMNKNKGIIVTGIIDNVLAELIPHPFIMNKFLDLYKYELLAEDEIMFDNFVKSLQLKDFLIHEVSDLHDRFIVLKSNIISMKNKATNQVIKDFLQSPLYVKRHRVLQLLISPEFEHQHLAHILFDLLVKENSSKIDYKDQLMVFESFNVIFQDYFEDTIRDVKRKILEQSQEKYNDPKLSYEQQIALLSASEKVKEKAYQKLREMKSKDESGSSSSIKARTYLDGLLKIPFGCYREEDILFTMEKIRKLYEELTNGKTKGTSIEIQKYLREFCLELSKKEKKQLTKIMNTDIINIESIFSFLEKQDPELIKKVFKDFQIFPKLFEIKCGFESIHMYIKNVKTTLDSAVYGHEEAKKQLESIICQWINGYQSGYCFGFEGPPGVGKTSLAKEGLSKCLLDKKGESRPFGFIQMGGNSGGNTLHGHSYTYSASTWGSIVQILMDKKCMNPIIFIDEVDKISKTEYGLELSGILTHLLDPTQNDSFQDKYFAGIELDLSKALFVLSYNDASLIDPILLERIHRIKFKSLSVNEKLRIAKDYLLPSICKKMGLDGVIVFPEETLTSLINDYTSESGVRRLKELLFEIVGEINRESLKGDIYSNLPIVVSMECIKERYFRDKHKELQITKRNERSENVGEINGLWANAQGKGGILKIQTNWRPSDKFLDLHLTGMQGDVMKESMNVALTVAWNLLPSAKADELTHGRTQAIHIHCPEGATPKDGPSAGAAIATCLYSRFMQLPIYSNIAITGELTLDGKITAIGGLDLKILGGIQGGITEFIYPSENEDEFQTFIKTFGSMADNIQFHSVRTIEEVIEKMIKQNN
jgi:ATP-dependent Lon protease